MTREEKLMVYDRFTHLIETELEKIPKHEIVASGKPENAAMNYYKSKGFRVFQSKVKGGYRCIGALDYWSQWLPKLDSYDLATIEFLRSVTGDNLMTLVAAVKDKKGTPDLLLVNHEISFVEVKAENEIVKPVTIKFFIKYGHLWPMSILRVKSR